MNNENMPVITDREELYDKCENMEQLFDKYYLPLLDKHYSKVYQLQQENKILKENTEHNDKVVDKVNWENQLLKKQLEEYKDKINWYENFEINKTIDKLRIKHNNQQQEFINYLEDEINEHKNKEPFIVANICSSYDLNDIELKLLKEILQKYKSITGVSDEKK